MSLIELMVAVGIVALVVILGASSYSSWINNVRIRNAAESFQNGIRLARNEAVQRAANVRFEFTSNVGDWTICVPTAAAPESCSGVPAASVIQQFVAAGGSTNVRVGASTGSLATTNYASDLSTGGASAKGITFSALGRAAAATTPVTRVDVSAVVASSRRLVTTIATGGSTRMCDPALDSSNPQGCS